MTKLFVFLVTLMLIRPVYGVDIFVDFLHGASGAGDGTGDVTGPNSSVNEDIVIFNGTTGKRIKDSGINVDRLGALFPTFPTQGTVEILANILEFDPLTTPSNITFETGTTDNPAITPVDAVQGSLIFRDDSGGDEVGLFLKMDDGLSTDWQHINAWTNYIVGDFCSAGEVKILGTTQIICINDINLAADPFESLQDDDIDFVGLPSLTTCAESGGDTTFSSATEVDVTAGFGVINTFVAFPGVSRNYTKWSAANSITLPDLTNFNTIFVDDSGTVGVAAGQPSAEFSRENIVLAIVNPSSEDVIDRRGACLDHGNDLRTLSLFLGSMNRGNLFTGQTDQELEKTSGLIYAYGIDAFSQENNTNAISAANPIVFDQYDSNSEGVEDLTVVDTANFDLDGGGTPAFASIIHNFHIVDIGR